MIQSVSRRSTFAALSSDGRRVADAPLRISYLPADHPAAVSGSAPAVAFAFGRKFGSAVDRNRARRRLRAAFARASDIAADESTSAPPLTGTFLISGSRAVLTVSFDDLVTALRRCFDRLTSPVAPTSGRVATS